MIMAAQLHQASVFISFAVTLLFSLQVSCKCSNPRFLNVSAIESGWLLGGATWYGSPNGEGIDGGACGYRDAVERAPFSAMVSAGGPSLFQKGQGCGACYQVKCTRNAACSGRSVTITITDECPGGPCLKESVHFDLSGIAFGAMAKTGEDSQLRNVGVLQVQYRRIPCNYPGVTVAFKVEDGTNPYYFSVLVEYLNGEGNLAGMELQEASNKNVWHPMGRLWGAVWKLNSGYELRAPFSLRLKEAGSGKILVARDVIPRDWKIGTIYRSRFNFQKMRSIY